MGGGFHGMGMDSMEWGMDSMEWGMDSMEWGMDSIIFFTFFTSPDLKSIW